MHIQTLTPGHTHPTIIQLPVSTLIVASYSPETKVPTATTNITASLELAVSVRQWVFQNVSVFCYTVPAYPSATGGGGLYTALLHSISNCKICKMVQIWYTDLWAPDGTGKTNLALRNCWTALSCSANLDLCTTSLSLFILTLCLQNNSEWKIT